MVILETEIAPRAIERFVDRAKSWEERTVHVQRVAPIIVESSEANRSVVVRTGWPRRLYGVAALRIPLQVETLRNTYVNVLGIALCRRVVRTIHQRNRPNEVPIIRVSTDFYPALRYSKLQRVVCRARRWRGARWRPDE